MSRAREFADLAGSADAGGITGKNMVVNGSMAVAQRSTQVTGIATAGYKTLDRYKLQLNSAGRLTMEQVADVHDGFANALKISCTTADTSIAADEYFFIQQELEGQDLQQIEKGTSSAKEVTVSFYVKGNAAATYTVELEDRDNNRYNSIEFPVTTSWTRVTKTFTADTTGTLDDDANGSLRVNFWFHGGSSYTGGTHTDNSWHTTSNQRVGDNQTSFFDSTSRTFFLTGLQLELGDKATPFQHEDAGTTLRKCQRYYYRTVSTSSNNFLGYAMAANTTNMYLPITFPTTMRSNPSSIDVTAGSSGNIGYWLGGAVTAFTSVSIAESGTGMTTLNCAVGSGLSAEKMYGVLPNGSGSIGFNAEL